MNRKLITLFSILIVYMLFSTPFALLAQSPGSSADPLVTKSYLDFALKFRNVEIKSGTVITVETGAMLVVTSGQLKVELKKGGMIIDLTNGRKITSNITLQSYHLIMVPDGDSCSFKATKDTSLMALGINDEAE